MLDLELIKKRVAAAKQGPWWWNLNLKSKHIHLEGRSRGSEIIMDFVRWGMSGARVRFQRAGLMTPAEEFARVIPGHEHHADWLKTIEHPDADFIAHARDGDDVSSVVSERPTDELYATDGSRKQSSTTTRSTPPTRADAATGRAGAKSRLSQTASDPARQDPGKKPPKAAEEGLPG